MRGIALSTIFAAGVICGVVTFTPVPAQAQNAQQPLHLVHTYRLPAGVTANGNFDHLVVDVKGKRIFATPEKYHEILVISTESGEIVHEIKGIETPHAILFLPDHNALYITDGGDGSVKVFNATTYQLEHRIPLLKDADSLAYDPARQYLYVVNGGADVHEPYSMVSVIDANTLRKIADIKINGDTLEAMAIDPNRPQLYVNDRSLNKVVAIDTLTRKPIDNWSIAPAQTNVTMALDVDEHRLFVGCRSGILVILDSDNGKQIASLPIVKGNDDTVFDPDGQRIYAAGDGAVSVYQETDRDHYRLLGNVASGPMGKTERWVPQLNELFVAVPQHSSKSAEVMVFRPTGNLPPADSTPPIKRWSVSAPNAERLVMEALSSHSYLNKLGLHAIPPGGNRSLIIANGNVDKIGKPTTAVDFANVSSGKTYCNTRTKDGFYDMKLWMCDSAGRRIGLLVMEIPFTAAHSAADAIRMAESVRKEMASQIPGLPWLFQG